TIARRGRGRWAAAWGSPRRPRRADRCVTTRPHPCIIGGLHREGLPRMVSGNGRRAEAWTWDEALCGLVPPLIFPLMLVRRHADLLPRCRRMPNPPALPTR